jgi:hypothetical protein
MSIPGFAAHLKPERLKLNGCFFISLRTAASQPFFGEVAQRILFNSEEGILADAIWSELPQHFPTLNLDCSVALPDYFLAVVTVKHPCAHERRNTVHHAVEFFRQTTHEQLTAYNPCFEWHAVSNIQCITSSDERNALRRYLRCSPERLWAEINRRERT